VAGSPSRRYLARTTSNLPGHPICASPDDIGQQLSLDHESPIPNRRRLRIDETAPATIESLA